MDPLTSIRDRRCERREAPRNVLFVALVLAACASERAAPSRTVERTHGPSATTLVSRARAALDRGDLDTALVEADAVLASAPDDRDALAVSGIALLLSAEAQIAGATSDGFTSVLLEDALERLARAPAERESRYAAARAAWLLSQGERALALAHAAARTDGSNIGPWRLPITAQRIEYDAAWLALRQRRAANAHVKELGALVAECLGRLDALAVLSPADPWTPRARAIVLASAGRDTEALAVLGQATESLPRDADVLEDFRVLVTRLHGELEACARLAAFVATHEWSAAGHLAHGWALCELARAKPFASGEPIVHAYAEADQARRLDPRLDARARELERACDSSSPR